MKREEYIAEKARQMSKASKKDRKVARQQKTQRRALYV